jgi:hypothetical protein
MQVVETYIEKDSNNEEEPAREHAFLDFIWTDITNAWDIFERLFFHRHIIPFSPVVLSNSKTSLKADFRYTCQHGSPT